MYNYCLKEFFHFDNISSTVSLFLTKNQGRSLTSVTFFRRPPLNYWLSKTRFCAISPTRDSKVSLVTSPLSLFASFILFCYCLVVLFRCLSRRMGSKTPKQLFEWALGIRSSSSTWPIYINKTPHVESSSTYCDSHLKRDHRTTQFNIFRFFQNRGFFITQEVTTNRDPQLL